MKETNLVHLAGLVHAWAQVWEQLKDNREK